MGRLAAMLGRGRRQLVLATGGVLLAAAVARGGAAPPLPGEVRLLADGALALADGREVVPAGVSVPPAVAEPAERAARSLLEKGPPGLEELGADRYGRPLVVLHAADGDSLQAALLGAGLAYADPSILAGAPARRLLEVEAEARRRGLGLWARPSLGEQTAQAVRAEGLRFAVVRGRVSRVARRGHFYYVDFGEDWRRDFTVRVDARDARRLRRQGLELDLLAGREVRVRGWLFASYGPMIEVTEREQIEVLE